MRDSAAHLRGILFRARSEEWLFGRAIRGDAVAFSEVYRRYHSRVYGFSLSRLLDPTMAEEATQETFVRLLSADPDTVANPRPWLFGVARNVCLELGRQQSSAGELSELEDLCAEPESLDEIHRQELGRHIILALRRMRPRYRTALVLRELHGMSSVEIADVLGTTPGAVDTLVSRSRDAFGKAYAEVGELPAACAHIVPLIYKRTGTGLSRREQSRLAAHVKACPACRKEEKQASAREMLAGVLPLLTHLGLEDDRTGLSSLLGHLDPSLASMPYELVPSGSRVWARVAATLALAAALVIPAASLTLNEKQLPEGQTRTARVDGEALLKLGPRLKDDEPAEKPAGHALGLGAIQGPHRAAPAPASDTRRTSARRASGKPKGKRRSSRKTASGEARGIRKDDKRSASLTSTALRPRYAHTRLELCSSTRSKPAKIARSRKSRPHLRRSAERAGKRRSRRGRT